MASDLVIKAMQAWRAHAKQWEAMYRAAVAERDEARYQLEENKQGSNLMLDANTKTTERALAERDAAIKALAKLNSEKK